MLKLTGHKGRHSFNALCGEKLSEYNYNQQTLTTAVTFTVGIERIFSTHGLGVEKAGKFMFLVYLS